LGIEVVSPRLCDRIDGVIGLEIASIQADLARIEERLALLGDSDEDRVEELLLRAARRLLLKDLYELYELASSDCEPLVGNGASLASTGASTVVEA